MAELDITYRCNCRCRMCTRWQDPRRGELCLDDYAALASCFRRMGVYQISISGGEPLMRDDVFDIIRCFSSRGLSVNLCTNGLLLKQRVEAVCAAGPTSISVSIDGAGAHSHDRIRGVQGAWRRIEAGLRRLLAKPFGKRPVVRVRMTICDLNIREIRAFYRHWHSIADDVLVQPVHRCGDAYYTGLSEAGYRLAPLVLAEQIRGTPLARGGYMRRLIQSLAAGGGYPEQPCYAGVLMVRIDPWGRVYPCLEQHQCVGSVRQTGFEQLWYSEDFNRIRRRLAVERSCTCWYNNTAVIGHYASLLFRTRLAGFAAFKQPRCPARRLSGTSRGNGG